MIDLFLCYEEKDTFYAERLSDSLSDYYAVTHVNVSNRAKETSAICTDSLNGLFVSSNVAVLIVLCGNHIIESAFLDSMIYAGLASGLKLIGLILPTHPNFEESVIQRKELPARLADNVLSDYASIYEWDDFIRLFRSLIPDILRKANDKIDNYRPLAV